MNESQRAAFRAAHYRFSSQDGELLLKVDEPNPALAVLLRNRAAESAAVITAFNPRGQRQDDAANRAAQEQLRQELIAAGHVLLQGRNEDPAGHWPVEESFLVPGLTLPAARAVAARYNQLAFLWMEASTSTPRLVETAAPS